MATSRDCPPTLRGRSNVHATLSEAARRHGVTPAMFARGLIERYTEARRAPNDAERLWALWTLRLVAGAAQGARS